MVLDGLVCWRYGGLEINIRHTAKIRPDFFQQPIFTP
jgi:hypothetical protein